MSLAGMAPRVAVQGMAVQVLQCKLAALVLLGPIKATAKVRLKVVTAAPGTVSSSMDNSSTDNSSTVVLRVHLRSTRIDLPIRVLRVPALDQGTISMQA